ncbi:MBG domain-containing protein, partial [Thomasclavelia sp.]
MKITKAQATIEVTNADKNEKITKTYDKKAVIPNVVLGPVFEVNVPAITDYTITYYDSNNHKLDSAPVDAGKYRYEVKVEGTNNYKGASKAGTIIINKAVATINVDDKTKVYGTKDPTFTYTVNGLIGDDTLGKVTLSRKSGEQADKTYVINAQVKEHKNYNITINPGTLTITKAQATIEVTNADENGKITAVYDKKEVVPEVVLGPKFEINVPEIKNYSVSYYDEAGNKLKAAPIDAGKYSYEVKVEGTSNYKGASKTGTIIINKAEAVININDAAKVYGTKDPTFTYTVNGLIDSDTLGKVTLSREPGEDVKGYKITAKIKDHNNYSIKINNGTLTITKAQATIEITNADENEKIIKTYNKKEVIPNVVLGPKFEINVPEIKNYSVSYYDEAGNKLKGAPIDAGKYSYEVKVESTKNYNGASKA